MKTICRSLVLGLALALAIMTAAIGEEPMKLNPLTPEEAAVILNKGTEAPFTGKFYKHQETGTYICRHCNAPLYRSTDKFDAGCGWPSFDDEIPGAVKRVTDADGRRTEILCARCSGHLGHVFLGEGLTPKNTRHCVNSVSIDFLPTGTGTASGPGGAGVSASRTERAIFAGGCFWGVEYLFKEAKGVLSTAVGFTGGHTEHPTYRQVCDTDTGHAEALEVVFDPAQTSYEELAKLFFEIHDPTQANGQGPDLGSQYRSEIFTFDDGQKATAEKLIKILEGKGLKVVTRVTPATTFWKAEDYHQDYYRKKGGVPYCHRRVKRF